MGELQDDKMFYEAMEEGDDTNPPSTSQPGRKN
jgi:hypothetical protein